MSEELIGNVLVAQSGGPTAVINASLAGVIAQALNHDCIEEIYGSLNGVLGILKEEFIDLAEESQQVARGLRYTPGSALGSCRYKIKNEADYERILEIFEAHNIRYFFYIGGNDSMDTADKVAKAAAQKGYALRVIGIPKTIDNDLPETDHCPGYGSAVKYICTTIRQMACDHAAMGQHDLVCILEVMGRNTGWLAAGSALTKGKASLNAPPHLIYLPEVAFSKEKCLQDVQSVLENNNYCFIVASEGLVDTEGNYLAADTASKDAFGHSALGGTGEHIRRLIEDNLQVKARTVKLGYAQRSAATNASKTDADEAFLCAERAVQAAVAGHTGKMVTLLKSEKDISTCETGLTDLSVVANGVKYFPKEWISEDMAGVNTQFIKYAQSLIQGEVQVPFEHGLPTFVKLACHRVEKKLSSYVAAS